MGLPGSGKTYLAKRMQPILKAAWYNADLLENQEKMEIMIFCFVAILMIKVFMFQLQETWIQAMDQLQK